MSILGSSSCRVSLVSPQMIKHIRSVWHKQMGWMILGLATCSCVAWSFGGTGKVCVVLFASQYSQPFSSRCSFSPLLGTVFHLSCPWHRHRSSNIHTALPGLKGPEGLCKSPVLSSLCGARLGARCWGEGAGGQRSTRSKSSGSPSVGRAWTYACNSMWWRQPSLAGGWVAQRPCLKLFLAAASELA